MRWLSPPDSEPEVRDERQVVEADIVQEIEPLADLLQDAAGDLVLLLVERGGELGEPASGGADGFLRDLGDVQAGDLHRQRLRLQPLAVADLAGLGGEEAADLLAHPGGVGLLPAPLEVGDDALEDFLRLVGAEAVVIDEGDFLVAGAVEDRVLRALGKIATSGR